MPRLLRIWAAGILASGAHLIDVPTLRSAKGSVPHHVFPELPNANAGIRHQVHRNTHMWNNDKAQESLYARFKDRVIEVGAYGDLEKYYAYCARLEAAEKKAKAGAATAANAADQIPPSNVSA